MPKPVNAVRSELAEYGQDEVSEEQADELSARMLPNETIIWAISGRAEGKYLSDDDIHDFVVMTDLRIINIWQELGIFGFRFNLNSNEMYWPDVHRINCDLKHKMIVFYGTDAPNVMRGDPSIIRVRFNRWNPSREAFEQFARFAGAVLARLKARRSGW